jgi:hypothetical protein
VKGGAVTLEEEKNKGWRGSDNSIIVAKETKLLL